MAIQNEPTRIQIPFADSGTKNVIPDTNPTPSASQAASWTDGFPSQCSLPLSAGGIPPARADFNGIFNTITQSERFTQEGGIWAWDATVDYAANRLVLGSNGELYWSVAQSGPNTGAGAQDPTLDTAQTYWASPKVPMMPLKDSSDALASTRWVRGWYADNIIPVDLYVDAVNGNDANDGYSAATAKKTYAAIMGVFNTPGAILRRSHTLHLAPGTYDTKHLAPGTYDIDFSCGVPGMVLTYDFQDGCVFQGDFIVSGSAQEVHLSGIVKMTSGARLYVNGASWITIGSERGPLNLTFENDSVYSFLRATSGGFLGVLYNSGASTISFSGNCTANTVAYAEMHSLIQLTDSGTGSVTFDVAPGGSVTGSRYTAGAFGAIVAGSPTKIPGSTNGYVNSLGLYV